MSFHAKSQDIECSKCHVKYVPFKKDFTCPKCDAPVDDYSEFIPSVIKTMHYHKTRYGRFFPHGWYSGSLSAHIEGNIFLLFDEMEEDDPPNPKEYIIKKLKEAEWDEQKYLEKHTREIALEVYKIYKDDKKLKRKVEISDVEEVKKEGLVFRIRKWFR